MQGAAAETRADDYPTVRGCARTAEIAEETWRNQGFSHSLLLGQTVLPSLLQRDTIRDRLQGSSTMRRVPPLLAIVCLAFAPAQSPKAGASQRHVLPLHARCKNILLTLYQFEPDLTVPDAIVMIWEAVVTPNENRQDVKIQSVSLEWSATGTGDWRSIGPVHLKNFGRYVWQVPKSVPDRIYLRLSGFDTAGRMNSCQTETSHSRRS
jgi:hypothetical protein